MTMETIKIVDETGMEYMLPVPGQIVAYLLEKYKPPFTQSQLIEANNLYEEIAKGVKGQNYPPDKA